METKNQNFSTDQFSIYLIEKYPSQEFKRNGGKTSFAHFVYFDFILDVRIVKCQTLTNIIEFVWIFEHQMVNEFSNIVENEGEFGHKKIYENSKRKFDK